MAAPKGWFQDFIQGGKRFLGTKTYENRNQACYDACNKKNQGSTTLSLGNIEGSRSNWRSNCEKSCQHEKSGPISLFFDKNIFFSFHMKYFWNFGFGSYLRLVTKEESHLKKNEFLKFIFTQGYFPLCTQTQQAIAKKEKT